MALEAVNTYSIEANEEGVDREAFKKIVKECEEWGTVVIINAPTEAHENFKDLRGLFQLKLKGRCGKKCSWLIWRDEPQRCWWIQHNLNPEHVHRMNDAILNYENRHILYSPYPVSDLGWHTGDIEGWTNLCHQEEEAYLEEIDDSFRATIRKRHERSVASSSKDRGGILRLRDYCTS